MDNGLNTFPYYIMHNPQQLPNCTITVFLKISYQKMKNGDFSDSLEDLLSKSIYTLSIGDDREWAVENNPFFDKLGIV